MWTDGEGGGGLSVEDRLELSIPWKEAGSGHEPFETSPGTAVAIARVAHLTVMRVTEALPFGKVPGTSLADTIGFAIGMDDAQMCFLGLPCLHPCPTAALSTSVL